MAIVEPMESEGGVRRLRIKNPSSEQEIGVLRVTPPEDVRAVVGRAREAQEVWAAWPLAERANVLRRALTLLMERQEEIVDALVQETGRSRMETILMEVFPACDSLSTYANHAPRSLADRWVSMHLLRTKKLLITYKPLGVVGIITPWNGPFVLALNPTAQALVAGNAAVIKPSEVTPFSADLVVSLFRDAGVPDGLVAVVRGDGETGAALVDAGVDKISFTGSVRTGRKVGEACGRNLVPCSLELGGKDPMIVCRDADLERAAAGAVFGAFFNSGQFCCSTERVYVAREIEHEFTRLVVEKTRALTQRTSGEFDVGPMIWPSQLELVERHVADARAKGAKTLCGGSRNEAVGRLFYAPTVLTQVNHGMDIMREETFGPVLPIQAFSDEEEAIQLANDSDLGLSGSVWSRDEKRAIAIAKRLETGSVSVNDSSVTYGATEAPFGGRKASGVGQVHGEDGLRQYTFAQPILIDRFNARKERVWYPYTADKAELLKKIIKWVWGTPLGRILG